MRSKSPGFKWLACLVFVAVFAVFTPVSAQIVEKYRDTGPDSLRLTLVVTGDGYTASQQNQFRSDAVTLTNYLLATSPWDSYAGSVNVWFVGAISSESGADNPGGCPPNNPIYRNTAFDATYWSGCIERLLVVNTSKVFSYVSARVSSYDSIFVLVNDTKYGGSGGAVSVTSLNSSAREILVHEVGHTFGKLADEYVDYSGLYTGPEPYQKNVTIQTNRDLIKWRAFIDPSTPIPTVPQQDYPTQTGLFEGAYYYALGVYRPAYNCKMRALGAVFCAACKESHALNIHDYAPLVDGVLPQPGTRTVSTRETFTAEGQGYQYLGRQWTLDGQSIGTGQSVSLSPLQLAEPSSTLVLSVSDDTPFIANYTRPSGTYQWTLIPHVITLSSVAETRFQPNGTYVRFPGVVSAVFGDDFYVQDPDRVAGIRVLKAPAVTLEVGQCLSLAGMIDTSGPNLTLTDAVWTTDPAPRAPPRSLGMNGRVIGGGALGSQRAVKDGVGLNNVGLLVKIVGLVTYVDPNKRFFYLNDAGTVKDGSGVIGVKVYGTLRVRPQFDPIGRCVSAIGVSSCEASGPNLVRIIKARTVGDVLVLH